MANKEAFVELIKKGYNFKSESVRIGSGVFGGEVIKDAPIFLPLKTLNRHGLIAGATGTGKTKTLQLITECLSDASVPVLLMDIKGDLSGIAAPGQLNDKIKERVAQLGIDYKPSSYPVELMSLSNEKGVRL